MTSFSEIIHYLNIINNRCKIPGPHTQLSTYGGIGPSVSPNYLPQPTHSWHFLWLSHFFSAQRCLWRRPVAYQTQSSHAANTRIYGFEITGARLLGQWVSTFLMLLLAQEGSLSFLLEAFPLYLWALDWGQLVTQGTPLIADYSQDPKGTKQ